MALETPRERGMRPFISATRELMVFFSPSLTILILPSRVLTVRVFFLTVSCRFRVHTMRAPFAEVKDTLTWARTSFSPAMLGSWTKDAPLAAFGGSSPVVTYLRHSMIVVLPEPLVPTMRVSGAWNCMVIGLRWSKDRIPRICSLSILDISAARCQLS